MTKKDRLSLDFPPGSKEQFDALKQKAGAATTTELFRRALSLYEHLLVNQQTGGKVILEKPDGERETLRIF